MSILKRIGLYTIFCLSLFICFSCTSRLQYQVRSDWYSYLTVPSMQLFAQYPGDYHFSNRISGKEKKLVKRIATRILRERIKSLYEAHTVVPPYFGEFMAEFSGHGIHGSGLDSLRYNGREYYYFTFRHDDKNYLLLHFLKQDESEEARLLCKGEFQDIYKTFYLGNDFEHQLEIPDFFKEASMSFLQDTLPDYVAPLSVLEKLSGVYKGYDHDADWALMQAKLTYHSFLMNGNWHYRKLLDEWYGATGDSLNKKMLNGSFHPVDISTILNACKNKQVIMMNENHFMPKHRYLLFSMLDSLSGMGFTELAVEDYRPGIPSKVVPSLADGYYIREPIMGELIRKARKLGMKLVSYDHIEDPERDETSARSLVNQTVGKDPHQKLVVLCGISHVFKDSSNKHKWMAYYFKEFSGIDPFTINQTEFENYSRSIPKGMLYVKPGDPASSGDLFVVNALDPYQNDRKEFDLHTNETIKAFIENRIKMGDTYSCLLYHTAEWYKDSTNAVPVRTFFVDNDWWEKKLPIKVPEGKYLMLVQDVEGRMIKDPVYIH